MKAVILLAHGARDPAWAEPLERLRDAVCARLPQVDVRLAFLEFMAPDLSTSLEAVAAAGARHVQVVPVFLAQAGHVRREVPRLIEAARLHYPTVRIDLCEALGENPVVIEAMATAIWQQN